MSDSQRPKKTNPQKLKETIAAIVLGLMVLSAIKNFSNSFLAKSQTPCLVEQRTLSQDGNRLDLYTLDNKFQASLEDSAWNTCLQFMLPTNWEALRWSDLKDEYKSGEKVIFNSYVEEFHGVSWMVQVTTLETSNSNILGSLSHDEQLEMMCSYTSALGITREEQQANLRASDPSLDLSLTEPLKIVEIKGVYFVEREVVFRLNDAQQIIEGKDIETQWLFSTILDGKWVKFSVHAYNNTAITGKDDFVMAIASSIRIDSLCSSQTFFEIFEKLKPLPYLPAQSGDRD